MKHVLSRLYLHLELHWLNLHLTLSPLKLFSALPIAIQFITNWKDFVQRVTSLWCPTPLCDLACRLLHAALCPRRKKKKRMRAHQISASIRHRSLFWVCINLTGLFVGPCCITQTQGKVLNEVLWRKSHVHYLWREIKDVWMLGACLGSAQSGVIHLDKETNLALCTYFKAKISRKGQILDVKLAPRAFFQHGVCVVCRNTQELTFGRAFNWFSYSFVLKSITSNSLIKTHKWVCVNK